jgi:MOSC domain-containing protein YiiM
MTAHVIAVSVSGTHTMSKPNVARIHLIEGVGVEGDAHAGVTVKHRSRVARDPTQPNLRQVHLIHAELFDELKAEGFEVTAGLMGENVTTRGIDVLGLPAGTLLHLGPSAIVKVTGLRNPCYQLDELQKGLMQATLGRDARGELVRKAGVMAIVINGGVVGAGDAIVAEVPAGPRQRLQPV